MDLAVVLEAVVANADDDIFSTVASHQFGTRHREPRVFGPRDAYFDGARFVQVVLREVLRSPDSEVGVVSNLQCASARAIRKAAVGVGLYAPGDAPEEELFVIRTARFAEGAARRSCGARPQSPPAGSLVCWSLFS